LARANAKKFNVVGIGTQDNLKDAKKFVTRNKVKNVKMYWDASGTSWDYFGVLGQPAAILMDKDGNPVETWTGYLENDEVLAAIAKLK
jgi:thioredoxin-related protein